MRPGRSQKLEKGKEGPPHGFYSPSTASSWIGLERDRTVQKRKLSLQNGGSISGILVRCHRHCCHLHARALMSHRTELDYLPTLKDGLISEQSYSQVSQRLMLTRVKGASAFLTPIPHRNHV